jgi:hypothetical protein
MEKIMKYIQRLERVNLIMLNEPNTLKRPNLQQRLQEQSALLERLKSVLNDLPKED